MKEKLEALKNYLIEEENFSSEELENETFENVYNDVYDTFEIAGREYLVFDFEEAEEKAREKILNSLWAFNAKFILHHTEFYENSDAREDREFINALQSLQERLCESANAIVKALIKDIDDFIDDALNSDGRGHFISYYDGEEYENGGFFIYRTN